MLELCNVSHTDADSGCSISYSLFVFQIIQTLTNLSTSVRLLQYDIFSFKVPKKLLFFSKHCILTMAASILINCGT